MITRAEVVDAVKAELDSRPEQVFGGHAAFGECVADRLHLAHDPLDALGVGVFVRRLRDWPIEIISRFGWCCVAIVTAERKAINRDLAWYEAARAAGVTITTMDWLPAPTSWHRGLADAIAFSAEVGAEAYVIDAEREWKGEDDEARRYLAAAAKMTETITPHVRLGFTSYALCSPHPTIPWRTFLGGTEIAIAQAYDREHALKRGYAERAIAEYEERGARRVVVGRGAYRRELARSPGGKPRVRWRTALEIEQHAATTPASGHVGTCFWPPVGRPPAAVLDAITNGVQP
jgi:hypothetical protein